jgi:protein SCO1/2
VALLLGWGAPAWGSPEFRGGVISPPRPAPDFALKTAEGADFRLSGQRDRVVALSFGYTSCPDVCPTTLAELIQVKERLGADGRRFTIAFVTVDPERDTPARLREYTRAFSGKFVALTGTPAALADVRKAYGVVADKRVVAGTAAAYLVDHTALVYVVDRRGRLRLAFPFGQPIDDMARDIARLLTGDDP